MGWSAERTTASPTLTARSPSANYSQTECSYLDKSGFGPDPTSDAYVAPRRREMEEDQFGRLEFVVKLLRSVGISEEAIASALAMPDHASRHAALMQILSKGGG